MNEYTVAFENGMRIRHDALARFTVKSKTLVLQDSLIDPQTLGGAMTVASIIYNRSAGTGISWWNPSTGRPISRPRILVRFRPGDVLTGEQLCECEVCV
jgi:hypothetical protein